MKENVTRNLDYELVLSSITRKVKSYLVEHKIQALVIGISGGLDSGINAAILKPICDELSIPLIGRYIHIETNKEEERARANEIGKWFCSSYKEVDLTELYHISLPMFEEKKVDKDVPFDDKIRRGNIKARMRMVYLYNLCQEVRGIVVDNDNLTEHLLGFWTLNGDVGDITPLFSLYKTEVYGLSKHVMNKIANSKVDNSTEMANALLGVINAVPTDGLGITSSDVEQFGAKTYDEVDGILMRFKQGLPLSDINDSYGEEVVSKVLKRHLNSEFKRKHPHRIKLCIDEMK